MSTQSVPETLSPPLLYQRFLAVRQQTEALASPLSPEDCQAQSMPDASPVKWHLAHVTWFFETFVLEKHEPSFQPFDAHFRVLFNSYYNVVGERHPRPQRGLLTRPSLAEVLRWRHQVNERMASLLGTPHAPEVDALVELGIQHEQQHQELLLTDVKHLLSCNGLNPAYQKPWPLASVAPLAASWCRFDGGLRAIGHGGEGFAFDNEGPRHQVWLEPYELGNRLVTHGDWFEFIADGGYEDPRWWLSAGWDWRQKNEVNAPLYWRDPGAAARHALERWSTFTLHGLMHIDPHTPVTHVSYFEADAFARWKAARQPAFAGARLPTEAEWEAALAPQFEAQREAGNFMESGACHPMPVAIGGSGLLQGFGDVWQWTSSSYAPYPGYRPWEGDAGEYNGKFMANQYVLRGGSCATPRSHIRASYRNFFPTDARWQFTGLRLARDARD